MLDQLPIAEADVVALMLGLSVFCGVIAVWWSLLARDGVSARAAALAAQRRTLSKRHDGVRRGRSERAKVQAVGVFARIARRLDLVRGTQANIVAQRLARAGWRSGDAVAVYMVAKIVMPFVFGSVTLLWTLSTGLPTTVAPLIACVGVLAGFYAPEIFVRNAASRRQKALRQGVPDALDLLVVCAEAGLSLDSGLTRVAREMERAYPAIADELGLTALELNFLPERRKALENLTTRTDLRELRSVVNTLLQTEKYGTPLAQSLRVLSAEYRNERMMKGEEKAAALPAKLTVPMIVFILPSLFVVLIGPAVIKAIDGMASIG